MHTPVEKKEKEVDAMFEYIVSYYNYWMYVGLMMIGFYAMMAKRNLIKKIIGMNIFQSSIIFFYLSSSVKKGGVTVPILEHVASGHGIHGVDVAQYANPLPHGKLNIFSPVLNNYSWVWLRHPIFLNIYLRPRIVFDYDKSLMF